jgi:uncharacterized protein YjiS (DUF1127 family)
MLREGSERSMHGTFKRISSTPLTASRQASPWIRWTAWLDLCVARWRERRALRELSAHSFEDIGLSPADVERECRRWPWDGSARDL